MFDFLIVGQGLAGSMLALDLIQQGAKICIIDSSSHSKASTVAGGVINAITGKRLVKCWDWERANQFAKQRYQSLDKFFSNDIASLFTPKNVIRIYQNEKEVDIVSKRRKDPECSSLISSYNLSAENYNNEFNAPLGCFLIQEGGFVNLNLLIEKTAQYLKEKNSHIVDTVQWKDITITSEKISWKTIEAKHLVLCQGSITDSPGIYPLFQWLPFRHAKGEILILKSSLTDSLSNCIINFGHWILPLKDQGILKLGATFEWEHLNSTPTLEAENTLLNSFKKNFPHKSDYSIVKHLVGIRPCTPDNKPFIGRHPQYSNVSIFNGLGAKGALYAPYWAYRFSKYLLKNEPLEFEVSIERFFHKITY